MDVYPHTCLYANYEGPTMKQGYIQKLPEFTPNTTIRNNRAKHRDHPTEPVPKP